MSLRIVLVDNFDSFTHNLVHLIERIGAEVRVIRADRASADEVFAAEPTHLVLGPGPGHPHDAKLCSDLVQGLPATGPKVLGVCLGHQVIGLQMGALVQHAPHPMHGQVSRLQHDGQGLFANVPQGVQVMRYHSLAVKMTVRSSEQLLESAHSDDGVLMALRHRRLPIESVQFHPESFMTDFGERMMRNWIGSTL